MNVRRYRLSVMFLYPAAQNIQRGWFFGRTAKVVFAQRGWQHEFDVEESARYLRPGIVVRIYGARAGSGEAWRGAGIRDANGWRNASRRCNAHGRSGARSLRAS